MIVVLDTNVIISALLTPSGPPAKIIDRWEADEFGVTTSNHLLNELERALRYPKVAKHLKWSQKTIDFFLDHYAMAAAVVEPQSELEVIEEDPDDNKVLECAIAGGASYIITGDNHLLELNEYQDIVILPPVGFLALLEAEKKSSKEK